MLFAPKLANSKVELAGTKVEEFLKKRTRGKKEPHIALQMIIHRLRAHRPSLLALTFKMADPRPAQTRPDGRWR